MHNFDFVRRRLEQYRAATVDARISPNDSMNNQWYFEVGRSAVDNIALGCLAGNIHSVTKVLDLPCGHGRVLRHLVALFPDAEFHACDLDRDGVNWCASTFGATPIHSRAELTEVDLGSNFNLIWIGSLFTHTSRDVTRRWMAHIAQFLAPRGIVVATLHGRWSEHVHTVSPYVAQEGWEGILADYRDTGYGYRDYSPQETNTSIEGGYGVSLALPHVILHDVEAIPGIRIHVYRERAWADHHDVLVFGKPSYDKPWPGMKDS
jgi:SAM-dependent methyltransferase